ncbi:hypothetical protein AcV7_006849 [Taiwanofungus camphoratus]|nr:hypothetical protein AcV7_006849 [Antrodia cinnamomea]
MIPPVAVQLNPPSLAYFRKTTEAKVGKLEELSPPGPIREGQWKQVQDGLSRIAKWMSTDGKEKPLMVGDTICFADITIASHLA